MVNRMLTNVVTPPYILLARSFFVILGCFAVLWGLTELPAFWRETSIKGIAAQIIAGAPFKMETLTRQVPIIDKSGAQPTAVQLRYKAQRSLSFAGGKPQPRQRIANTPTRSSNRWAM